MIGRASAVATTREDFWRLEPPGRAPTREWHHFIVAAPGLELLINFSVSDGGASGTERTVRAIVIARTDTWLGFIDTGPADAHGRAGECRVAGHRLAILPGRYELELRAPDRGIVADLNIEPRALPMIAPAQPVGGGRRLSWLMVPRVAASGFVEVGGRRFELRDAAGYHDHNWGRFAWGDDFCWEWGVGLPDDPGLDDALILSSLQDRARGVRVLEQLFVWRGGRNVLAVSGPELELVSRAPAGRRAERPWQLPAVMSLLRRRDDADLPAQLELQVAARRGRLHAEFRIESVAELVLPSDRDPLGLVTIHECVGPLEVELALADEPPQRWRGRGVFEFVRAGPGRRAWPIDGRGPKPQPTELGPCTTALELLQAAVALLERRAPGHATMLAETLAGIEIGIDLRIEREQLGIVADGGRTRIEPGPPADGVLVRTDFATALALVDERLGLERALLERRLELRAERSVLGRLARACRIFVHGLVRSPGAEHLLDRLRQLSHAHEDHDHAR